MSRTPSYRSLIHGIEKVYFKVSLVVLHRRMDSYSKNTCHTLAHDIKPPLLECADTIITHNQDNQEVIHTLDCTISESATTNWHSHAKYPAASRQHMVNRRFRYVGDLSSYFKKRNQGADLHPSIQEILEHSVWDHVHSTLRYARQGDDRNSKLHAGIACNACKELAHYMDAGIYRGFVAEVECHLDSIKKDN